MITDMKGIIKVKNLNNSGLYISEIDWDECYKSKKNPKGNFVMIIEPLEGFDKGVIYYEKAEGGYRIEGEAYIIEDRIDRIEAEIKKWKKTYKKAPFDYVEK